MPAKRVAKPKTAAISDSEEDVPAKRVTKPKTAAVSDSTQRVAAKRATKPKTAKVVFELPAAIDAEKVALCGEFNDWSTDTILLERDPDGAWHTTVALELGKSYRYRYLINGEQWENSWQADAYVPNPHGTEDSVVVVA
jgi:1,4-alpha-glucan branching enzyme